VRWFTSHTKNILSSKIQCSATNHWCVTA